MEKQENAQSSRFIGVRLQEEYQQKLCALKDTYGLSISDTIRFCVEFAFERHEKPSFPLPDHTVQNLEKLVAQGKFEDIEEAFATIFSIGWEAYNKMIREENSSKNYNKNYKIQK
ncbi:MAG: hypothetical protein ACP5KK_02075 [Candidatus Nanoarchaeia archaeon]